MINYCFVKYSFACLEKFIMSESLLFCDLQEISEDCTRVLRDVAPTLLNLVGCFILLTSNEQHGHKINQKMPNLVSERLNKHLA